MKIILRTSLIIFLINVFKISNAQVAVDSTKIQIVEASCGQCNFGMSGKSCDLAVKIKGKAYFVKGTNIDDHGDAHAKDGFCMAIKKAEVIGQLIDDKFIATYFKVINEDKKTKKN
jgi:hypothetical protein